MVLLSETVVLKALVLLKEWLLLRALPKGLLFPHARGCDISLFLRGRGGLEACKFNVS